MTIFLVFGLFAGLYMLWLLFSLATYALPVGAGVALALSLRGHDCGYATAILCGFVAGTTVLALGRLLLVLVHSPLVRLALVLIYAVPAGIAGFHAVRGVMGLALDPGAMLSVLSWIGGVTIAIVAGKRLADTTTPGSMA